jgi:hypothetical protein
MTAGRPRSEARDIAVMLGDKFYEGTQCLECGTTTRYTTGSRCVLCAREVARIKAMAARAAIEAGVAKALARELGRKAMDRAHIVADDTRAVGKHPALGAPYVANPADVRMIKRVDVEAGTRIVAAVEAEQHRDDIYKNVAKAMMEQQIEQIAAREREITDEEVARAKVLSDIRAIETGGLTLCGVKVTEPEMAEYIRTGIVPNRIMQKDNSDG